MNHNNSLLKNRTARQFKILISGRDSLMLEHLKSHLDKVSDNLILESRLAVNGTVDPLDNLEFKPDLLI